ncbi:3-hydroxy-3-methylglutaryl-CoA reductase [Longimicrobium terrae]|uniref:Hydroxymethylglutaryl-CoA reductase (NADPH) n=1 Tax=Longimicrobium terrae TaxID=1639882 RepID=A0A841H253_9BACT|nr:3-hydroxy-3-methylglutaryl-CoA reductase [Longimicrobium terrae]MBB4637710.1 hydroxymethylglutaryl-CoA reductase (NADPH) [Longimicrobium terrae]MBB6072107.1 hydroxymethylglutaryl-CoA reductase (NADPH) [Longimicrobium terrae]NNC29810.1 3-hydroxy-3-methylglutaryl-CoA reductase [Longimicrobium terrae]
MGSPGPDHEWERLRAVQRGERPVPPRVPAPLDWSAAGQERRLAFLRGRGVDVPHLAGRGGPVDAAAYRGNIEHFIGMAQVPVGLIGPLRINGMHVRDDVYVPLATSEGALVASYDRGARLLSRAGGVSCVMTDQQVQRAPAFAFATLAQAAGFAAWAAEQGDAFRAVAARGSRFARLTDMRAYVEANRVYLLLGFTTGDAAGQNMVTFAAAAICADILERTPVAPEYWFVESNLSGDKKATSAGFLRTRGRRVTAEALLPRALVMRGLRTTPERMCDCWRMGMIGGVQAGATGASSHVANALAALFLACGQDVACVGEASVGVLRMEVRDGGLYVALTLPNLIVGTVGGGTRLPTARECLSILDCVGEGRADRFAEICAAVALAGEISIVGALAAGEFAAAHLRLGRGR